MKTKKAKRTSTHTHAETATSSGSLQKSGRIIEVWMTQDIKLSANYQSAGVSIGMKASVAADESPERTTRILKKRIDKALEPRFKEMQAFLAKL